MVVARIKFFNRGSILEPVADVMVKNLGIVAIFANDHPCLAPVFLMFQHEEVTTKIGVKTFTTKMRAAFIAFGMKIAVPFKLIGIGCGGGVYHVLNELSSPKISILLLMVDCS